MPPKRKAAASIADDASANTRPAKRASTRGKAAPAVAQDSDGSEEEVAPPKKRTRTTKGTKGSTKANDAGEETKVEPKKKGGKSKASKAETSEAPKKSAVIDDLDPTSYTDDRALALFNKYVDSSASDADEEPTISPEGLMELCEAADMPMDGARPLLLAWICKARKMGNIYKGEWCAGMKKYRIDSTAKLGLAMSELDNVLLSSEEPKMKSAGVNKDPYSRDLLVSMIGQGRDKSLKDLYLYTFTLSRAEGQRNVDIETAAALWAVTLTPRFPIITDLLRYIADMNGDDKEEDERPPKMYKGVTKDQWQMAWSFVTTVKPDLSDYDADGGWPTIFDEFVAWKKSHA